MSTAETTQIFAPPSVLAIHVGLPETLRMEGKLWRTAIHKRTVTHRLSLDALHLAGDDQANKKYHGGPDKAVCCFPAEHYPFWRRELARSEEFAYGAFGENFTVSGMTESAVCIGDVYEVGTAVVQVSQPRQPCVNLARRWEYPAFPERMKQIGHSGFYLRVLRPGEVGPEDRFLLAERSNPDITVEATNRARYRMQGDRPANALLASLPQLSEDWRETFRRRK